MAKVVKRFRPKFVKRLRDRPSGIAQTGAHGTSHRQNPPDIHRLGWAPRPFPRTGMTGQPNSSIMGAMGTGQLSYYTDEDREEYERQSGPPGKGGNYKSDMQRQYINKLKSRPVIGLPVGVIGESELREVIRNIISELNEDPMGRAAFNYEILRSEDGDDDEDDEDELEEFSGAAAVAGYSLPLGASNHPSTLKSRGEFTAKMYGGTPVRTLKLRRMKKS
tara:strand:- start:53 stop:712 length:660 start_codon:yes stop_codon:yes gene_type:complete